MPAYSSPAFGLTLSPSPLLLQMNADGVQFDLKPLENSTLRLQPLQTPHLLQPSLTSTSSTVSVVQNQLLFFNKDQFHNISPVASKTPINKTEIAPLPSPISPSQSSLHRGSGDLSLGGCTFTCLLDPAHSEDSSHVVDVTIGEGKSLRLGKSTSNSKTSFVSCSSYEDGGGLKVSVSGSGVIELAEVHFSKCSSPGNGDAVLIEVSSLFVGTISFTAVEFGTGDDNNTATLGIDLFVTTPDQSTLINSDGFLTLRPDLPEDDTFGKGEKNELMGKDGDKAVESLLFIWYPHTGGDKYVEGTTGEDHANCGLLTHTCRFNHRPFDWLCPHIDTLHTSHVDHHAKHSIKGSTTITTCSSSTADSDFLYLSRRHSPNMPLYLFFADLGSEGRVSNNSSDMSVCGFAVYPDAPLSKMIVVLHSKSKEMTQNTVVEETSSLKHADLFLISTPHHSYTRLSRLPSQPNTLSELCEKLDQQWKRQWFESRHLQMIRQKSDHYQTFYHASSLKNCHCHYTKSICGEMEKKYLSQNPNLKTGTNS
ncbi:hypothetical protein BLNAU_18415 [Blattamonas nauphoetae]|uniref:Uncharacterized protein n=1 Tax=Blattamonas nauphoetae TaxID=2049346 RepID=A0ABQ9X4Z2_9EUKA|nr:hypothetical protein BLNAU_18415 [Blattamonas nauphoetae]